MKNIAIIPARSGSKGLKDKNIKLLGGKSLLAYSIEAAQKAGMFSEIMVSTDSQEYAHIAKMYGANVPFLRSEETSGDNASSWDTVKEVLRGYQKMGQEFDTVALLQPTSPLRTEEDICGAYKLLFEKDAEAITSVCEMDHSPLWAFEIPQDGSMKQFRKTLAEDLPRQKLRTFYRLNGAVYIRRIKYTSEEIRLLSEDEYAYVMPTERSVDIDTQLDFSFAEIVIDHIIG